MSQKAPTPKKPATMADRLAFAAKLRPIALRVERQGGIAPGGFHVKPGIKADLGIYQSALESEDGISQLARPPLTGGNNIFGMTASPDTYWWPSKGYPIVEILTEEYVKPSDVLKTDEVLERAGAFVRVKRRRAFRSYTSWEASYLDWARRIQKDDMAAVFAYALAGNLKGFALALQTSGYATSKDKNGNPDYAAKLEARARAMGAIA